MSETDLPDNQLAREQIILRIFGSPDRRQIDGLGGADLLTSKVAVVGPPSKSGSHIDYTFGQVAITEPSIDWNACCGNVLAAVAAYAVDEGYASVTGPVAEVRIHSVNMGRILTAWVPVMDGRRIEEGDYQIDGVPGTGARITLDWADTSGSFTGKLLPTDNPLDRLQLSSGQSFEVSIVDAGIPIVFVRLHDLGLTGHETPPEIDNNPSVIATIEEIRKAVANIIGAGDEWERQKSPIIPPLVAVAPPYSYRNFVTGELITGEAVHVVGKVYYTGGMCHKAFAGAGTITTGTAAKISGTIVEQCIPRDKQEEYVIIGHQSGKLDINVRVSQVEGQWMLQKAQVGRTARRLMDGIVHIPDQTINAKD